jgi:hypothetical protein
VDKESILWQLHRYRAGGKPLFIDADELIRGSRGKFTYQDLRWVEILYPIDFFLFFKSGLYGERHPAAVERDCARHLGVFINDRYQDGKYISAYRACLTPTIRRLILAQALVATFKSSGHRMQMLHVSRRGEICKKMSLSEAVTEQESCALFDSLTSKATIEDMILGNIGYLLLWKDLKDSA